MIDYNATVRQTAKEFGVSKSTVHKVPTERPFFISSILHFPFQKCISGVYTKISHNLFRLIPELNKPIFRT